MIIGLFTNVFGVLTQRNTIRVLIIVNEQFEKMEQNIGVGKKVLVADYR
jgi:hypothetical protein